MRRAPSGDAPTPEPSPPHPAADAATLLAATEEVRAGARRRLRGSWVPLLGFGLLALAAVPLAGNAFNFGAHGRFLGSYPAFAYAELTGLCVVHTPGTPCLEGEFDGAVLRFLAWGVWFALIPLAWLACARWYRVRGERRGLVPRNRRWALPVTVLTAVVLVCLLVLVASVPQAWATLVDNAYATPWYLVGLGLTALGLTERDWTTASAGTAHALLLTGYLGADRATGLLPWHHPVTPTWIDGPQAKALLLAGLLLLPALVALAARAAAARRRSHPASALPRTVTP
ncbi:hypothetical protein ACFVDU_15235 [Streptomyces albidoflavus]